MVEGTNKAEIRPEKQSEKAESCRESVWNEIQLEGPWRQKQTSERNKKGVGKLGGFVKALTATSPARDDEPVGKADTSKLDYIRWQYDADTEKERSTQPSRIMLNMTRTDRHWRLYDGVKFKEEANPSCMMFSMTQRSQHQHLAFCSIKRSKHYNLMWWWGRYREAITAVLGGVEYDRDATSDGSMWRDDERDAQVQ